MTKRNILLVSLASIVLLIVGAALGGVATTPGASVNGTGLAIYGIGGLAALVGWVMGLVKTAQLKRWGWFVAVLLLGSLGALIYGAAGPEHGKV